MKKKILFVGLVLSLVVLLAMPTAVSAAEESGGTEITGILGNTATLTVPGTIALGGLVVGDNTGQATSGSVVANATGWTLTVADDKTNNAGCMTIGGLDDIAAVPLTNPIEVGMTAGTVSTISAYQSELAGASGYGAIGTFAIPLYANQPVIASDEPGSYSITLTFTTVPGT